MVALGLGGRCSAPIYRAPAGAAAGRTLAWGAAGGRRPVAIGLVLFYHALGHHPDRGGGPGRRDGGDRLAGDLRGRSSGSGPPRWPGWGSSLAVPARGCARRRLAAPVERTPARAAVVWGLAAGVAFALFGILISRTGRRFGAVAAGSRPGRLVGLPAPAPRWPQRKAPTRRVPGVCPPLAGVLDITANVFFLVAVRQELLSLVVVIMSLYPATTIALAAGGARRTDRHAGNGSVWRVAAAAVTTIALGASG